jgi:hypothetical protein
MNGITRGEDSTSDQHGFRANGSFDSAIRRKVGMTVEVLLDLAYLTKVKAEDPVEVRGYVGLTEDRLADLIGFLGWFNHKRPCLL